jgi:ketosteroid isomerase-like protein
LDYDTPAAAEHAFYAAFAYADVDAMMSVWDDVPYIICVHPMGPQLIGPEAIRDSWWQIFRDGLPREFELEGQNAIEDSSIAVRVVQELIRIPGVAYANQPVIATNVYQYMRERWYLVVHHASVGNIADVPEDTGESAPIIH